MTAAEGSGSAVAFRSSTASVGIITAHVTSLVARVRTNVYDRARVRIDRYLFGEMLKPSLLGLGFYSFVLLMNTLFIVVTKAFQSGAPPSAIFELILLSLPKILVLTIPMALLFGLLIGLGRLSADSEIVALRASGVSYRRMVRPVLGLGLLGFVVSTLIYNLAVPWTTTRTETLRLELFRTSDPNREIRSGVFFDGIPNTLVYAEDVARNDPVWPLRNVLIQTDRMDTTWIRKGEAQPAPQASTLPAQPPAEESNGSEEQPASEPLSLQTFVFGNQGRIEVSPDGALARFFVERGEIHQNDPANLEIYKRIRFDSPFMTVVPLTNSDLLTGERKRSVQEYTLSELFEEVRRLRPKHKSGNPERTYKRRRAMIEIHWRFAVPAACIVFSLLGFPLGLVNTRGGKSSGFAVSLVVITLYWMALSIGRDFALEGKISLVAGSWGPDILLMALAGGLLSLRQKADLMSFRGAIQGWVGTLQSRLASGRSRRRPGPAGAERRAMFFPAPRTLVPVIDRYIGKRYLAVFALVLLSAGSLYAVVEVRTFIDSLIQRPLPVTMALKYLLYFMPGMLKVITPIAAAVAALITLGILCRANEDTALKAAGISIFRISMPLLVITAGLCVSYFVVQDYIAPWSNQRAAQIRDEIEGRVSSVAMGGTRWLFGRDKRLYGYGEYNPGTQTLQGVSVLELKEDPFRIRKRLWAQRVSWKNGNWIASDGWLREFKGDDEPYTSLQNTPLAWPDSPDDFARHERSLVQSGRLAEEMNFVDLRQHIRRMKNSGYDTTRLRVSLYEKLAFPFAPLVMVLIGLPFAFRAGRRGSLYGMGIALLLVILYWSMFAVSSALGHEQILPPLLAAWAPNLLFTLTGGYLLLSTRS